MYRPRARLGVGVTRPRGSARAALFLALSRFRRNELLRRHHVKWPASIIEKWHGSDVVAITRKWGNDVEECMRGIK